MASAMGEVREPEEPVGGGGVGEDDTVLFFYLPLPLSRDRGRDKSSCGPHKSSFPAHQANCSGLPAPSLSLDILL